MPSYLSIYKTALRHKLREKIRQIPPGSKKGKSLRIAKRLVRTPEFVRAKNILIYISRAEEAGTSQIIEAALKKGKGVFAPKVDVKSRRMSAIKISNPDQDLISGPYGIREPRHTKSGAYKIDLMILPGLGFDASGARIGKGLGFFDRFLQGTKAKKIGIGFREQLVSRIPLETHDVLLDKVITD